jgi:hypothetical protein
MLNKLFTLLVILMTAFVAQAQTARVQVIHNSPDPTVDVYAGTTLLLDNFAFRTASAFGDVPAGIPIPIGIAPASSTSSLDAIFTETVTFQSGSTYVVTASGVVFNATTPFGLIANANGREVATNPTKVDVAVLHGAPDAPAVDVVVRTGSKIVSNLSYGSFTPYLSLNPGEYFLDVKPAGSAAIVQTYKADLSGLAGKAVYVFASGFLTAGAGAPFGLFAALADGTVIELPATPIARVQVIHNSPTPTVDVYANGAILLNDFEFRKATSFIYLAAGVNINLAIAADTSTSAASAIATYNVNLTNGKTYIVTATGVVGSATAPFGLNINDTAREQSVLPTKVDFAVLHGSPDAPAVDVSLYDSTQNLVSNLAFNAFSGYLSVDPGVYYLDVKLAGTSTKVGTFKADLSGLAGQAIYVMASGFATPNTPPSLGLFAVLNNGTVVELPAGTPPVVQTARLQVIHNSPNPTVDVYVNGDLLLNDFVYRTATPFITVPAGVVLNIGIAPATSTSVNDVIANFPATLDANGTYIVTASGILGSTTTPFTLNVNATAKETASTPSKVDISVLHGSPDAPNVDVDEVFTGNVISNLAYGAFTPYLSLDPAIYDFAIRPAGSTSVVATYRANLSGLAGKSAYVVASGILFNTATPFGLLAILADGTVIELPVTPTARVQVIHNSPSPTVDIYAGNTLLLNDFAFRTATPFVNIPAGRGFNIGVALGTSTSAADAIASFPVALDANKKYTIFAAGIVGSTTTPFDLYVYDDALEASPATAIVSFSAFHGAPGAPAVDIVERTAGPLVQDLAFGENSPYLNVPAALYVLDVKVAGTAPIVATYNADLSLLGGNAIRVFASGILGGTPAFGLYAALVDGTVVALPLGTPPVAQTARLQVIHNSPNPTVDVYVNGDLLLNDFVYRTATPFITVPAGVVLNIGIAPANSTSVNDVLANFPATLDANGTYIVTASGILGSTTTPFTLNVNATAREIGSNTAKVDISVLHGSPNAPNVDVDEVFTGNVISNLAYGAFTPYLSLDPAIYDFAIRQAGNPAVVATFRANLSGLAGKSAYVLASGLVGSTTNPFGLLAVLADGTVLTLPITPTTRVQVIHNSPSPTVDVYAGNTRLLNDFAFRTATPFVDVPAGRPFNLGVAPGTSASVADVIASYPVNLDAAKKYTIIAAGIVGNASTPFNLYVYDDALEASPSGTVSFSAFHGAPGAPAVDVVERLGGPIVENLAFGENTPYLNVAPITYVLDVKVAGTEPIVATYIANLEALDGAAVRIFASGILGGTPAFGLYAALANGTVVALPSQAVARVQVIHNSPEPVVDVYLDGEIIINDFEFRQATPFVYLPAGAEITLGVAPGNSQGPSDIIANFPVTLENGKSYVVAASGIVGNATTPFTLIVSDKGRESAADQTKLELAILHGATDAPPVDLVPFGSTTPLLSDLTYGDFTDYVALDAGEIILDVQASANQNILAGTYGADFSGLEGFSGVVFASGLLNGQPGFSLFLATPDGFVIELPSFSRAQVIHNSPSPTVDVYLDTTNIINDFGFRDATGFGLLPSGTTFELGIAPENSTSSDDAIYTLPVTGLKTGKTYIIVAAGVVGNATTPFQLYVNENGRFRANDPTTVDIELFHGAPDAPEVDITLPNGTPIFDNVQFGEFTPYISVPPAQYILNVTPANNNGQVIASYVANIAPIAGEAITVFASGYLAPAAGAPGFAPWVALADGTTFPLPLFVNTNELDDKLSQLQLAPNPTSDILSVKFNLSASEDLRFRVQDMTGRLMMEGDWGTVNSGVYSEQLEVSGLSSGMYILEIVSDAGQQVVRFAVQR